MKVTYGYCRISQRKQNIQRQVRNIQAAYPDLPEKQILREAFTGTRVDGRKVFEKLLKAAREGKVERIIFDSVSRMSRDAESGFALYRELYGLDVDLVFLKEPHINTRVYREAAEKQIADIETGDEAANELMKAIVSGINRYMMRLAEKQIMIAFQQAEKEVQDLQQRTKEGLQTAVLNGKTLGRPKGLRPHIKKEAPAKKVIRKYSRDFDGTLPDVDVLKLARVSRNTFYKYKRQLREDDFLMGSL